MSGNTKPRQLKVIEYLVQGSSIVEVSRVVGVSERQVYRWLKSPGFKYEMNSLQLNALEIVSARLVNLAGMAVNALESVMKEPTQAGAGVKLRASLGILENITKWRELVSIENRLTILEGRLMNGKNEK